MPNLERQKRQLLYVTSHPLRCIRESASAIVRRARGGTTLSDELPWIPWGAIRLLETALKPGMRVFEYGSGGSTLFLARRVSEVVSVEHDPAWKEAVQQRLDDLGLHHVTYRAIAPDSTPETEFMSHLHAHSGHSFRQYVTTIHEYPDAYFDLVLVDGRARNACVRESLRHVKPGGMLLLDNSDRERYQPSFELLQPHPQQTFHGMNPYQLDPSSTTVWTIGRA